MQETASQIVRGTTAPQATQGSTQGGRQRIEDIKVRLKAMNPTVLWESFAKRGFTVQDTSKELEKHGYTSDEILESFAAYSQKRRGEAAARSAEVRNEVEMHRQTEAKKRKPRRKSGHYMTHKRVNLLYWISMGAACDDLASKSELSPRRMREALKYFAWVGWIDADRKITETGWAALNRMVHEMLKNDMPEVTVNPVAGETKQQTIPVLIDTRRIICKRLRCEFGWFPRLIDEALKTNSQSRILSAMEYCRQNNYGGAYLATMLLRRPETIERVRYCQACFVEKHMAQCSAELKSHVKKCMAEMQEKKDWLRFGYYCAKAARNNPWLSTGDVSAIQGQAYKDKQGVPRRARPRANRKPNPAVAK